MKMIAVIDTETNWQDEVMSIGVVIANPKDLTPVDSRYYLVSPECTKGGMYSHALYTCKISKLGLRKEVLLDLISFLESYHVSSIFAYNAYFDYSHLKELSSYDWYDILKIAAYKQTNHKITDSMDCCRTGRLKRNYGVEAITCLLLEEDYHESHNGLLDAIDELRIMYLLGHSLDVYEKAKIN